MSGVLTPLRKLDMLRSGSFVRSVGVLMSGTAVAHLITALALPVATRLYSPADFSVLAVFSALLGIMSVAACLRFDVAIPLPEDDADAANILAAACASTVLFSAIVGIWVTTEAHLTASLLDRPEIAPYLWLLPVGLLFAGFYNALQFWFVRRGQFAPISRTKIAQSFAGAGTQIGLGFAGLAPLGLLLSQLINNGAGCLGLGRRLVQADRGILKSVSWARMRSMCVAYSRFPRYSTLEALCNAGSMQLPIIMIGAMSSGPEVGYLNLSIYAIQAPMGLLGGAVAQVYLSQAPSEHRSGRLGTFTCGVLGGLLKTGVGPLLAAGILAPDLFALVFGAEWRRAGELVAWMTPWFVFQFLSAPVSMALHITGRQRTALALQVIGLTIRVGFVYGAFLVTKASMSEAYALGGFVFYALYLLLVMRVVAAKWTDLYAEVRSAAWPLVAWIVGAVTILVAVKSVINAIA